MQKFKKLETTAASFLSIWFYVFFVPDSTINCVAGGGGGGKVVDLKGLGGTFPSN